jgi:pyocin large subunit-like protein
MAHNFIERAFQPHNGLEIKVDHDNGVVRIFNPASDTFGAYNADDTTRTFFKPDGSHSSVGQAYFDRQPGDVVPVAPQVENL